MAAIGTETVTQVHHWNESLFSFRTTRDPGFRFENGHFVMLGLEVAGRPLMRAYSIASPNWEEHLEFFSIKVPDGPLTSRLQHLQVGDSVLVSRKPTGTLVIHDLKAGRHLYLLSSGTGLAPFLSIIQDPETYERFETVIVTHGVRQVSDLAYRQYITETLPAHELLGDSVSAQLRYHPTVTREAFATRGRLTDQIDSGELASAVGLPPLDPQHDRFMICGSAPMLRDCAARLDALGFVGSPRTGEAGDYVIERAFVDK